MTESKHTPGPWDYDWLDGYVVFGSPQHPNDYFMRAAFDESVQGTEEIANAHLVSAAPELLEACEKAISVSDMIEALDCLRLAIAKAKGEH